MHYDGLTYRPPYESSSMLLQVTTGCSHNACRFCTMYQDVPYTQSPLSEIEEDIAEMAVKRPWTDRVFLVNGDAFSLPADQLLTIGDALHEAFPRLKTITGYARIGNIAEKSDEDLRKLAQAGFAEWNIGLESGLDDVLRYMGKGYTVEEARTQMTRLNDAGLPFSVNMINALAGPDRIHEHAQANAAILNDVQPCLIFVSPLHIDPGSRLEQDVAAQTFTECTMGQYIEEEIELLQHLEMKDCTFYGMHVSNPVAVLGDLPYEKESLIAELKEGMAEYPEEALNSTPRKGHEGRVIG